MSKRFVHIVFTILVAIVMLLASTGFTMVVEHCSMSESSVCCCELDHFNETTLPSSKPTIVQLNFSCYSEVIVGGLNDIRGIVPENVACNTPLNALETITPDFQSTPPTSDTPSLLPLDFRDVTSSKSDINIQISSFLI